jgi:hypothetical protein
MARSTAFVLVCLTALAGGCTGGRYKVTGKVTYEDGTPVEAGTVVGEATVDGQPVSLQGAIAKDGTFTLGSSKPGDGAVPGAYRFVVMPPSVSDADQAAGKLPLVDGKYGKFDSSGITLNVKPERNVLDIKVSKPKPKPANAAPPSNNAKT